MNETFKTYVIDVGLYGHRGFVIITLDYGNQSHPSAEWFAAFEDWFDSMTFRVRATSLTEAGLSLESGFMETEALAHARAALAEHLLSVQGAKGDYFRAHLSVNDCGLNEVARFWLRGHPSAQPLSKVYRQSSSNSLRAALNPILDLEPIKSRKL